MPARLFRLLALCAGLWLAAPAVAEPSPDTWAQWLREVTRQPVQVLKAVGEQDAAAWPPLERQRLKLLEVRALLELGRTDEAARLLTRLESEFGAHVPDRLKATWHAYRGSVMAETNDVSGAHREFDAAYQAAREAGDIDLQGFVLMGRVQLDVDQFDMHGAAEALERLRQLGESRGDAALKAHQRYWAGIVQLTLEDNAQAADLFRQATELFHALDDRTGESDSQRRLAIALVEMDRAGDALAPAERAIALLQALDDEAFLALAHVAYAQALAQVGRRDEALAASARALAGMAKVNDAALHQIVWLRHAQVLRLTGQPAQALAVAQREVQPLLDVGHASPTELRKFHLLRAETYSDLGQAARAREAWLQVVALDKSIAGRVLSGQLESQRALLDMRRLQTENELLQLRNERVEQALDEEAHKRLLGGAIGLGFLVMAAAALLWMRRLNRHIAIVADHDSLTGLLNRRSVVRAGQRALDGGRPFAVLLIDVDHFKRVNDTLGHAIGDEVLRQVAQRLRQGLRRSDLLARWGGEEFLVLLPDTGAADAQQLAERQRQLVSDVAFMVRPDQTPLQVTVSVGLALVSDGELQLDAAIDRADQALYRAKQQGRDRWVAHDEPPAARAEPPAATPSRYEEQV